MGLHSRTQGLSAGPQVRHVGPATKEQSFEPHLLGLEGVVDQLFCAEPHLHQLLSIQLQKREKDQGRLHP